MTMRDALTSAMNLPADGATMRRVHERGLAIADEDTMSRAIHDVYCGVMADHEHPSEKDREQARAMMAAIQKLVEAQVPA